jgi:O-antigen ligase
VTLPTATILPWCLFALGASLPLSLAATNLSLGLVTALTLAGFADRTVAPLLRARLSSFIREPVTLAVAAYCCAGLLSSLLGEAPRLSLAAWPKDLHKLWVLFALAAAMGRAGRERFILGAAAGAAIAAAVGLCQSLMLTRGGDAMARAQAFVHPVVFGEILGLLMLGGVFMRSETPASRSLPAATAWTTLLAAALVLNQTRMVIVALAAGLLAAAAARPAWRRPALGLLAAGAAVVLAWEWMPTGGRNIRTLLEAGPDSPHRARLALWRSAWEMFRERQWTGVGVGVFRTAYSRYAAVALDGELIWGSAHNLYLHQLAERGLAGFAALSALFGALAADAWRKAASTGSSTALWALSAVAAMAAMNITETAFQTEQVATAFLAIWSLSRRADGDEIL